MDKKLEIVRLAYDYLLSKEGITPEIIEENLIPQYNKPKSMNDIFKRFCESAQNRQMLSKVIGSSIGGFNNFSNVLFNFDPYSVVENYQVNESSKLFKNITEKLRPKGQLRDTAKSIWPQYCQSIIDSAYFLSKFKNPNDFYKWVDYFANDYKSKPALPLLISIEVTGIGFSLACDLLKELGYTNFGKPDVHLIYIFKELGLIENDKNQLKLNINVLRAIDDIAEKNNVNSFNVDRIFWLIGSGDFFLSNPKTNIGRNREDFVKNVKNIWKSPNVT